MTQPANTESIISFISLGGINIIIISDINLYSQASYDYVKLLFENVRILRLWRISRQSRTCVTGQIYQ
jgi:hypothetical protein